jgi:hypothetical protein
MEEKIISLIQAVIKQNAEIYEKIENMQTQLNSITKANEDTKKIKDLLVKKKVLTKKQILEELGISGKSWRGWGEVITSLSSDPQIDVHKGMGRSETIIIYLNDFDSLISMASRLFKGLKDKQDYGLEYVSKLFEIDAEKSKQVINETARIFPGRFERGAGGLFRRKY